MNNPRRLILGLTLTAAITIAACAPTARQDSVITRLAAQAGISLPR